MLFRRSARLRCAVRRHLSFLLPCIANPISPRFTVSARLFLAFGSLGFRLAGWRRGENGMRRCLAPSTCRRLYRPRPLLLPAVTRIANRALACHSRPPGTAGDSSARRRSIQARPLMRDATGARTPWNGHCGRRRMWAGPRTAMGGEWYEQGEREEPTLLSPPSLTAASITTTLFSSGADGIGRAGSAVPRSAVVVLANKYRGRLGSARNSAAEIACDDIMEADCRPHQKTTVSVSQLLRGE